MHVTFTMNRFGLKLTKQTLLKVFYCWCQGGAKTSGNRRMPMSPKMVASTYSNLIWKCQTWHSTCTCVLVKPGKLSHHEGQKYNRVIWNVKQMKSWVWFQTQSLWGLTQHCTSLLYTSFTIQNRVYWVVKNQILVSFTMMGGQS